MGQNAELSMEFGNGKTLHIELYQFKYLVSVDIKIFKQQK